ncbi:hypothetical protein EVAR_66695_1 [Eumeta japonica]|uniref:Uncharacterized protein n=1 Tax=Eumeta variegata TaxID=151549 RepID=A0A4C1ZLN1_EUMVA|nr:hypothetical protein EVAR_66695_1 [Eumeta japonica]
MVSPIDYDKGVFKISPYSFQKGRQRIGAFVENLLGAVLRGDSPAILPFKNATKKNSFLSKGEKISYLNLQNLKVYRSLRRHVKFFCRNWARRREKYPKAKRHLSYREYFGTSFEGRPARASSGAARAIGMPSGGCRRFIKGPFEG